ncbi:response regulator transcription factor [Massilia phyllosphaerae]|uniref:response regulator transcription factor n=1 Tax=Massilia phyllosphaerae TaxID=3106034 RepID=UPI002B1CB971|nr:response regulator transcription factor [Massilia sp. SGZ-792]
MKILLVEDDPKAARLLARGLEEDGYAVTVAASAEQAAPLAGDGHAIAILDWMLPGQSGAALCRAWRQRGIRLPVLMLTARDGLQDRVEGLDSGADDYLVKPFEFDELLARVRALLRRAALPALQRRFIGDLAIDPLTHKVTCENRQLSLTPKEYAILILLDARPGHVVSRRELAEQVWHVDLIAIDNLIDVHIKNLRRKFHCADSSVLVETVRGQGFRLGGSACV